MKNKPMVCNVHGTAPANEMKKLLLWNSLGLITKQKSTKRLPIMAKVRQETTVPMK